MPNKIKFYLHNNYQANEICELLTDNNIPTNLVEPLTEEIYGKFYEVGFDIEYDNTGKITSISMIPKI